MYDMRQKEIINIKDGKRFGFIADIDVDEKNGHIKKIIVPGSGKILGVFGRETEYCIEWKNIKQIGDDIILVDVDTDELTEENKN